MGNVRLKATTIFGLLSLPSQAMAATEPEQTVSFISYLLAYGSVLFVVVVGVLVYLVRFRDKRRTPLDALFDEGEAIYSVSPDTSVTECVAMMSAKRIGAIIVLDQARLVGIFTERDALTKVLAGGLDAGKTKVSEVMTRDPYCIPPDTTVGEAMQVVTQRRFRHLPVVKDGRVLAVISSGDLTHWMVKDQVGEVQELVELAAHS